MVTAIVKGLATALHQSTGLPVYIDFRKQKAQFPCFYIKLLETSQEQELTNRYWREHDFDVMLFQDENGEVNDMQGLRDIADTLLMALEYITVDARVLRGTDMSYRVTDKVLHFFVSYNVFIAKVEDPIPMMESLQTEGSIKHGE